MTKAAEVKRFEIQKGLPQLMGAQQHNGGYNFTIAVDDCEEASLVLYPKGSGEVWKEIPLTEEFRTGGIAAVWIEHLDADDIEYNYRIDGKIITDPCAKAVTGRHVFGKKLPDGQRHSVRGILSDKSPSETPGIFIPYPDMILYKLHVRGFTAHRSSRSASKGTFRGLAEKIPYLKELGVTSVELMPAYDFLENRETRERIASEHGVSVQTPTPDINYWGYTEGYYFTPKAAFCEDRDCIREFQHCVDSFHRAGMECLMEFYFSRKTNPLMIVEILRYWKLFYHIDGFHLVGDHIPIEIIAQDGLLKHTKILYQGFAADGIYPGKLPKYRNLAEYNSEFMISARCFLKGDENQVARYICNNRRNPAACGIINYMAYQDGFTLADMVTYNEKHNEANGEENRDGSTYNFSWNCGAEGPTRKLNVVELRRRQMKNAVLLLLMSQGTPMIYAGDERCNSQEGNNNAYCQDNPVGWVDWGRSKRCEEMWGFVKEAIAFRKSHPILHMEREPRDTDYLSLGFPEISYHSRRAWFSEMEPQSRSIGILYCGEYARDSEGKPDSFIYIACNMHWNPYTFALPQLPENKKWYLAVDTADRVREGFCHDQVEVEPDEEKGFVVSPRTIVILLGK